MANTKEKKLIEEKEMRFCPKCKGEDISMNIPDAFSASQGNHPGWTCNNCGLKLPEFPFKKNMKTNENCIFCKIVKGEAPSFTIYEDENTKAFLSISQVTKGHTLVIPKKHYEDIFDTPEETLKEIIKTSKKVAFLLKNKLGAEGINLVNSSGGVAQQDVFHYHMHVIPRYSESKFNIDFKNKAENKDLDKIKNKILNK